MTIAEVLMTVLIVVLTGNLAVTWRLWVMHNNADAYGFGTRALTTLVEELGKLLKTFGEHLRANRESQRAMAHYARWLAEHINKGGPSPPPPPPEFG